MNLKKLVALLVALSLVFGLAFAGGAKDSKKVAKIGVLRTDSSSEEALAWENYLKDLCSEMGVTIDFTTALESADDELAAIQKYASLGYNGVILTSSFNSLNMVNTCEKYGIFCVTAAAHPDFEDSDYTLSKDESIIVKDYSLYPHYVGAFGPSNYGEVLAGYQMGTAAVKAGFTKYSVFTGAAAWGQTMHALRVYGLFVAMHDADSSVSYNGMPCTMGNWREGTLALCKDLGINLNSFKSSKFQILAQAGGYSFLMGDAAAAAAITNLSATAGVECVFCSGSADAVAQFAPQGAKVKYIGNDAVSKTFQDMFKAGTIVFDIAKYQSYVGPAFSVLLKSIYDGKAVRVNGKPVSVEQQSLQLSSAGDYDTLNKVESKAGGYFFSAEFLSAYLKGTKLPSNASGYTHIDDATFVKIASLEATLGKGGLYETTNAITAAYKSGGNEVFKFAAE